MTSTVTPPRTSAITPDHAPGRTPQTHHGSPQIDLLTPRQTCRRLEVTQERLLALVNAGALSAYDLGGMIRLRFAEVEALAADHRPR